MDLYLIAGGAFLTLFLLIAAVRGFLSRNRRLVPERLAPYAAQSDGPSVGADSSGNLLKQNSHSSIGSLDRLLVRRDFAGQIALDLTRADVPLRVGEYLLIRWLCALVAYYFGWLLTGNLVLAVAMGVVGYFMPRVYVKQAEQKRIRTFNDQLVDAITLMCNSLKSGYTFLQGMEVVTRDMPAPIAVEFGLALQEMDVGAGPEEALTALTRRVRSRDLDLLVTAMLVQRAVGGNLSEMLENIAHTIRERLRIQRDVRTLTSQERWSGYIIGALPIFLVAIIAVMNRSYVDMLFSTAVGRIMLGGCFMLDLVGLFFIRRIIAIDV